MNPIKSRYFRNCMFFVLLAILLCLFTPHLFADSDTNLIAGSTSISAAAGDTLGGSSVLAWFISFAAGNPKWAAIIALLVAIRIPMKMLMTALDSYAKKNLPPNDYALIVHYEHSKAFSILSWLLDTLVSVKLPVIKGFASTAVTTAPQAGTLIAIFCGSAGFLFCGCASIDPPLPGQTTAAPMVAFTNGPAGTGAYVLGHFVSTNQFEIVVQDAAALGQSLVLKEWPAATNYISDIDLAVSSLDGVYSHSALTNVLAQIPLKNPSDRALLDSAITTIAGEAAIYIDPFISKDTNAWPYMSAGLYGFTQGLGGK